MKAAAFDYATPRDVTEALAALVQSGEDAKLLAGGQSLGPMLNLRLTRPKLVVDISRVAALSACEDRGDAWWIGACVTHAAIEDGRAGVVLDPMLRSIAKGIAYRAIRNRGTIGGSLAHADPAADWPLAMAVRGASIHVRGPRGDRAIAADTFMAGAYATALAADEMIIGVSVPKISGAARWGYYKFCRKTGEFPQASAAIVIDPERKIARAYLGALSGAPRALPTIAMRLARDGAINTQDCDAAVATIAPELDPIEARMQSASIARAAQQVLG
jgi:aerobic carbon-monoxide dehydrogenase medium subunit